MSIEGGLAAMAALTGALLAATFAGEEAPPNP